MLTSLDFLMSIPGAAIVQTDINEDERMHSVSEMFKNTVQHGV